MKLKTLMYAFCSMMLVSGVLFSADDQEIKPRQSPYAETLQRIGTTDVKITYHRPGVKGREIWGKLVPYGGDMPWRAGANDATTFSITKDVTIEGRDSQSSYTFYIFGEDNGRCIQ